MVVLVEDVVGEQYLGDSAVGVGVTRLVERGELRSGIALGDEAGGEVLVNVGFELLQLREHSLGLHVVSLLLLVELDELRARGAVV